MSSDQTRRRFLQQLGLGAAAVFAGCERRPVDHARPILTAPLESVPGVSTPYATACMACPAGCGAVGAVREGRPIKLEGLTAHPLSRGGLCARGQAQIRGLYDPGRLRRPTVRGAHTTWARLDAFVAERSAVRGLGRSFILARATPSPSGRAVLRQAADRVGATLVEYQVPGRSAELGAWEALYGVPVAPWWSLGAADLLVTFGGDPLGAGPQAVATTAARATRRRANARRPLRHLHVEGDLSLTGAAADERWLATTRERRRMVLRLLRRVAAARGGPDAEAVVRALQGVPEPEGRRRTDRIAAQLLDRGAHALVASGADDPLEQLAAVGLARLLGSVDRTLDLDRPNLSAIGRDQDLVAFLGALEAGEVSSVIFVDADPLDDLPGADALAAALDRVPLSIAVTDRPTRTAAHCVVVAAAHHALERWGDLRPRPGVLSVAQPLIRPIFDTRHPWSSLLAWSDAPDTDPLRALRALWYEGVYTDASGVSFDAFFGRTLQGGSPPGGADWDAPTPSPTERPLAPALAQALEEAAPLEEGDPPIEVSILHEVGVGSGRHAHNPWLRELPDPLTRVAWEPCVRVAPETAARLGASDGDLLDVRVQDDALTLPAKVLAGQHPAVLGVPMGYGRVDGGDGAGSRNAAALVRVTSGQLRRQGLAAQVAPAAGRRPLPLVQTEADPHGRPHLFEVSSRNDAVAAHEPHAGDLWGAAPPGGPQWHLAIDLDACTGCSACVVACQAENNIPIAGPDEVRLHRDMHWLRIDRYITGDGEDAHVQLQPMLCQQCGRAPCETVCPVAATVHSVDGLNQQVYNRCVGTRYCANNCPYKVRRFNWFEHTPTDPLERLGLNPDVTVRSRGVMEKCTFCVQRIHRARRAGEAPLPACAQSCPARAIEFGDGADPGSAVAQAASSPRAWRVLAELGVEPSVSYLARVRTEPPGGGG